MKDTHKSVSQDINDLKASKKETKPAEGNELMQFFIGVVLLGVGLFMLSKRVMVYSSWYSWRIGSFNLSSGTITIPLIIGIIWYFCNSKSIWPKFIIPISIIFIVVSIIMSVRIDFITTSMFDYILMFGMIAAGFGLILKILFKKRN